MEGKVIRSLLMKTHFKNLPCVNPQFFISEERHLFTTSFTQNSAGNVTYIFHREGTVEKLTEQKELMELIFTASEADK